jgi:hypothetical protein
VFVAYAGLLVIGALLLAIALFAAVLLALAVPTAMRLATRGAEATGHVVGSEGRRPGGGTRVRVAYETPGGRFETRGTSYVSGLGVPVPVRYDPAKPARATTLTRPGRRAITTIPVVLAVAAVSAGMIVGSAWYFAGVHSRLQAPLAGGCFALALALGFGFYACRRYAELLGWRRMVSAEGTVRRFDEHAPGGPGILISFEPAGGRAEFWARAGSVLAGVGDQVTIRYDPAKPSTTATVQTPSDIRAYALGGTVLTLIMAGLSVFAISQL